jgi:hypothetical protein
LLPDEEQLLAVNIQFNGITCFIPPCFCWDLIDKNGARITTVSSIDLTRLDLSAEESKKTLTLIENGNITVEGHVYDVKEGPKNQNGKSFIVTKLVGHK